MRWLLISLGFIIISWIFFVASFGFASPAQAETWSCSYRGKLTKSPKPIAFIRKGGTFKAKGRGFESLSAYHINQGVSQKWLAP